MEVRISIAEDFSKTPGARYYDDGPDSGEEFFDKKLRDKFQEAIDTGSKLIVDLDGTEGYATSFLDEAFRKLAETFGADRTWNNLEIISNDEPDWIAEIKTYIYQKTND